MNKAEYDHFHSYQDLKDMMDEKLNERANELLNDMWYEDGSILEAIKEQLGESEEFAAVLKYARQHGSHALLGAVTIELIDHYLWQRAEVLAEDELL